MAISLAGNIRTVFELKENADEIFEQIHKTGRPVIITVKISSNYFSHPGPESTYSTGYSRCPFACFTGF